MIHKGVHYMAKIELKKQSKLRYMAKDIFIPCHIHADDEDEIHKLAVLKECLEKVGIELTVDTADEEGMRDYLMFKIDFDKFDTATSRRAGRKKDYTMDKRYKSCTVAELKEKLDKGMKKTEIMRELGCPKPTLYRIIKNLDGFWDKKHFQDYDIWDFTS